jgi:hypothetical protein
MMKDLGFHVSSFLLFGFLFSTMTFANNDSYFPCGCETNHAEVKKLRFNNNLLAPWTKQPLQS